MSARGCWRRAAMKCVKSSLPPQPSARSRPPSRSKQVSARKIGFRARLRWEALPLSQDDIFALYQSNERISPTDERELNGSRPDVASFPNPVEFQRAVEEMQLLSQDLRFGTQFWADTGEPQDLNEFERMLEMTEQAIEFFKDSAAWQLDAIQAGRDGEPARLAWDALADFIDQ